MESGGLLKHEENAKKQHGSQPKLRKVSSEGEMRGVRRKRPVEKGNEKAMEEKELITRRMRGSEWRLTWGRWLTPPDHDGPARAKKEEARKKKWADCDDNEEEGRQEKQEAERENENKEEKENEEEEGEYRWDVRRMVVRMMKREEEQEREGEREEEAEGEKETGQE